MSVSAPPAPSEPSPGSARIAGVRRATFMAMVAVGVVALVVAGWAWVNRGGGPQSGPVAVNVPVPALAGETLEGRPFDAASLRGHVTVINVWATWCAPCEAELPDMARLASSYADRGVRFLGIDYRDDRALARGWQDDRFHLLYPSLYDAKGQTGNALGFPYLPDTYVVDASGTVRWEIFGATDEAELSRLLDQVLAGSQS